MEKGNRGSPKEAKKEDYSLPKSYRIISLIDCLAKVSEKILATRLAYLATTTGLLHPSQVGGRLKNSAIDAVLALQHQAKKDTTLTTSAVFLDIKGAFDHVSINRLLEICQGLGLPKVLCQWIFTFMTSRSIQLVFDNRKSDEI